MTSLVAGEWEQTQEQDGLRVMRAFVSAAAGYLGDQTYAGTDNGASTSTRQFLVIGPNGVSVEGQPIGTSTLGTTSAGGVTIPPVFVWLGLGALAFAFLKR